MSNIKTVCKLAGVSTATVSRTLRNPHQVSEATRAKVFKAIEEAGYHPNMKAASIKTGKSNTILVLVSNLNNPFFMRIIKGIEKVASERGYYVFLGNTDCDPKKENEFARLVLSNGADGLITLDHTFPFSEQDAALGKDVAMVSVCERIHYKELFPVVKLDDHAAAKVVTEHLVKLGHKHIGVVAGQRNSVIFKDRFEGILSVIRENGLEFDDNLLFGESYTLETGVAAVKQLLKAPTPPTAFICFNDDIALGVMHELHQQKYSIPDDFSVTGFDNIYTSGYLNPSLTTIDQPAQDLGSHAADILIDMMQGKAIKIKEVLVEGQLLERNSTGKAKS